jgi:hypothetical protein
MNCQEFEMIVNDLASGRLWDSSKREQGLAHTGACEQCAARLANERLLSYELGALVREERGVQAPARLKRELLTAFATQNAALSATVVEFPPSRRTGYWAVAIAAAAVIGFALVVPLRGWFVRPANDSSHQASAPAVPAKSPTENAGVIQPDKTPQRSPGTNLSANNKSHETVVKSPSPRAPAQIHRRTEPKPANAGQVAAIKEIKSSFIPLTYLNNATADDGGVLIRVEVSRDKLAALGLPLNLERSGEMIKADILMGDDGVARAIRLVQ